MRFRIACTRCGTFVRFSEEQAGLVGICPDCRNRFALRPVEPVDEPDVETEPRPWWPAAGGLTFADVMKIAVAGAALALMLLLYAMLPGRAGPRSPAPAAPVASVPAPSLPTAPTAPTVAQAPVVVATAPPPPPEATSLVPSTVPAVARTAPVRPPVRPIALPPDALTDQRVTDAIVRGVEFLLRQFDPARHELRDSSGEPGLDALYVYALLHCTQANDDPRLAAHASFIRACVDRLKEMSLDTPRATYAHSLRANALALTGRAEDREVLWSDCEWLMRAAAGGAYTYVAAPAPHGPTVSAPPIDWDNSNSQYGVLGVWAAAQAGIQVPLTYWRDVEKHWSTCQALNGQWDYKTAGATGTLAMTAAGITALFVTQDHLDFASYADTPGLPPMSANLHRGLNWLEEQDNAVNLSGSPFWGYTLYGIERVGLASGFKYFGSHDWYRELAAAVLRRQQADGSWGGGGNSSDTPFALLFLARGNRPVAISKLRCEGFWANHPRDVANLTAYASHQLERTLNWQIVSVDQDWSDWAGSPVLYLSSHRAPALSDAQVDRIRDYVMGGGLLFTQADDASPAFDAWAAELAARLFPNYPLAPLAGDHPLWSVALRSSDKPPLKAVSNGARLLMVHSPTDISRYWQLRQDRGKPGAFELGTNLLIYASGKRDAHSRLSSPFIPPVTEEPLNTLNVARLQYAGNWDPEPYAWTRFGRWFQRETSWAVNVTAVPLRFLRVEDCPFAHLTGTDSVAFSAEEIQAVANYVKAGGVLLIDTCGGRPAFLESARSLLSAAFPADSNPAELPSSHPVLNTGPPGMEDVSLPRLRLYATEQAVGRSTLPAILTAGKGAVLISSIDLTSGLLGTGTWNINGYTPSYCESFLKNALLWSFDRGPREAD